MRGVMTMVLLAASLLRGQVLESPALSVTGQIGGPTIAAAVAGNTALAGAGYRLILYDISDPATPREVGALAFADVIRAIAIVDTRAYVAAGSSGLHIIDFADPSKPSIVGSWNSPGSSEGVAVNGTKVYLADGPFGLQILDVSAPQNPAPIGRAFDDFFAFDVAISGNVALIAGADAGLLIADVSDPRSPKEIASLDTPGYARGVSVTGSRAVIADQWEGLRIVDVSDPRNPKETAALATRSWAMDVTTEQSTALVAAGETLDISANMAVVAASLGNADAINVSGFLEIERLTLADGQPIMSRATDVSSLLTPTGLAIDPFQTGPIRYDASVRFTMSRVSASRAEGSFELRLTLPASPR